MTRPRYTHIADIPLPTDAELVPHLQSLLEKASRRQLLVMFLDRSLRPLPVIVPTDVDAEADPEEIEGIRDFFTCLALDEPGCTLVLTFERPGPAEITARDQRWLRLIREAAMWAGFPFRGPYLLLGSMVRAVAPETFAAAEWLDPDEEGDRRSEWST